MSLPVVENQPFSERREAASPGQGWSRGPDGETEGGGRLLHGALIAVVVCFLSAFLILPLAVVFSEALRHGWRAYAAAITEPEALAAVRLTLLATVWALLLNTVFGLFAAWCLGKHRFRGRNILISLIDLPFAVSPVVAGLLLVMLFGRHSWLGGMFGRWGIEIIFAVPGIVLATAFVTLPMIARELIPIMESQGTEEEEAARLLGANGLQIFWHVTLPNIRWALLYGIVLCTARAMGEFGAVSVVSGHIRGLTTTLPLHVEILYNEYRFSAAFATASLLTIAALVSLVSKRIMERAFESDHRSNTPRSRRKSMP
ncbi:MAG: sulfate ABC transporter permease subunit CysW [Thermogutta sp.]